MCFSDIEFSMPLKRNEKTKSPVTNDSQDTGYASLDLGEDSNEKNPNVNDDDDTDEWLQTIGIEEDQIKKLNSNQVRFVNVGWFYQ